MRARRTSCGSWCTCAAIVTNIQLSAECFAYRGCARRSNPCWGAGDGPCGALAQARAGEGPCGGAVAPRAVLKPAPWPPTPGYRRPGNATTLSKRLQEPAASYSELVNACRRPPRHPPRRPPRRLPRHPPRHPPRRHVLVDVGSAFGDDRDAAKTQQWIPPGLANPC